MSKEGDSASPYAQIYIYSGRPNPHWSLSLEEWSQLTRLIATLPKLAENGNGPFEFPGQLGYTGFFAHFSIVSSYPDVYYVAQHQQAVLSNPGGHVIYNDQEKLIEKWFKDSANRHGIPLPI
ncbi:unnamed protein product [Adineta ricciae]|uniref:Uncharacterized protein n=2 Tax=Adineta ricciae TaxID=249248 RepID=A0A815H8D0_ADIRI|nr:unnamed protein product [Adineta ricciae]